MSKAKATEVKEKGSKIKSVWVGIDNRNAGDLDFESSESPTYLKGYPILVEIKVPVTKLPQQKVSVNV